MSEEIDSFRLDSNQCHQCGYIAKHASQLVIHYRVHTGDRPYRCELCGLSFTQKNNLTRHMQIHGGRFRYKCSYDTCNFATRRYESFKQHMIQHGPMPYQCRLCDKSYFFTQCNLHKHISRMHGDLPADQQQELLTLGQLSTAELAQKRASSSPVFTSSVIVSPKGRWQAAFNSRLKMRRQRASYVHNDVASNSSHDEQMKGYFKAEPADNGDGAESYADSECIDLDNWDSLENDEDDSTSNHELTQYSAVSHSDVEMRRNPTSLLPTHVEDCMVDEMIPEPVITSDLSVVKSEPAESSPDASDSGRTSAEWYHCQTCDIYFRNIVMYTIHAGAHNRLNPLQCNVCGRVSRDCYEFTAHLSFGDHCRVASSRPS